MSNKAHFDTIIQRIRNHIEDNIHLFLVMSLAMVLVFNQYFFFGKPFIFQNDQVVEYHALYTEWIRLIRNFLSTGTYPFYSWSKFLGSDFYSSTAFYVNGDIFLPMLLFFKNLELALAIETIVLIYVSAFTFKLFLINFGIKKKEALFIVPFVYALNGIVGLYFGNYMFHRFYAFLPLLFLGIELYLRRGRFGGFVFSVSLLYLSSFYFMFPTSIFLIFYFIFRYSMIFGKVEFKDFFFKALKLSGLYLIGLGLVAFLMLPTILYMINSPRLDNVLVYGMTWPLKVWIGMIFSFLSGPFPIYSAIPNIFQSGFDGHEYWYSFYISVTLFIVLFSHPLKNDRTSRNFYWMYLFFGLVLLLYPFNRIMHAFAEPTLRISFLLVFYMLLHGAYILDQQGFAIVSNRFAFLAFVVVGAMGILFFKSYIDLKTHLYHLVFLILSLCFLFVGFFVIKTKKSKLIIGFIVFEVTLNLMVSNFFLSRNFYYHEPNLYQDYVDYFQDTDSDLLFRTYVNPLHFLPTSNLNLNQSMVYNYMSTSSYESFYEPAIKKFLHLNGFDWHIIHLDNPTILKMLGVKYYMVYSEDEIPGGVDYEYVSKINFLKVYRDRAFLPIGYTYSNFVDIETIDQKFTEWLDVCLLESKDIDIKSDIEPGSRSYFKVLEKYQNGMMGEITMNKRQILFLSIPNNAGWKIFVDGQQVEPLSVQGGFIGLKLESGYHHVRMYFTPYGFKAGVVLTLASVMLLIGTILFVRMKSRVK